MSALLQRCRLEGHHSRTVERAVMQTEVISCCFSFFSFYIQNLYPAVHLLTCTLVGLCGTEPFPVASPLVMYPI
jgi:hypothetical protein